MDSKAKISKQTRKKKNVYFLGSHESVFGYNGTDATENDSMLIFSDIFFTDFSLHTCKH